MILEAFKAMERQLKELSERQHKEVKIVGKSRHREGMKAPNSAPSGWNPE